MKLFNYVCLQDNETSHVLIAEDWKTKVFQDYERQDIYNQRIKCGRSSYRLRQFSSPQSL